EKNRKVLKTLSIVIARDRSADFAELRGIDFSGARANFAYWKKVNFTDADFFRASLGYASFRESVLKDTQFREAKLTNAVFAKAECERTNFELADLRNANFTGATLLNGVSFKNARVHGVTLPKSLPAGAINEVGNVNVAEGDEGSVMKPVRQWLADAGVVVG